MVGSRTGLQGGGQQQHQGKQNENSQTRTFGDIWSGWKTEMGKVVETKETRKKGEGREQDGRIGEAENVDKKRGGGGSLSKKDGGGK